jgi:hypothetical protein
MDQLLESREITYAQAARFILPAAGAAEEKASLQDAFALAVSNGWLPQGIGADEKASLGDISYLSMGSFELKGGILYSIFPGPRYAYRELLYQRIIQGKSDPSQSIPGERLLLLLGRTLSFVGE